MKKILSSILVCVLLVGMLFTLASCGKRLSGRYEISDDIYYEFKGNEYTASLGVAGFAKTTNGTYEIKENNEGDLEIIFTEEGSDDPQAYSFSEGEEDGVKYIKISGVKYTKADK